MPKLVSFAAADYPPEEKAKGVESAVKLALVVDVDGKVTDVEVVDSGGAAFDAAAMEAARRFTFTPAMRGETPVKAKILYLYRFELNEPPSKDPPAAPEVGQFSGRLRFSGDVPLAGANLELTLLDGQIVELTSDPEGRFDFGKLPPGRYRLSIRANGFEPYRTVENIEANVETAVVYRLSMARSITEVVIEGERDATRPVREVTRRTLSRREISRVPGTGGDALRAVQSLPGVARPPALAGLLIVRGSAPQDTGVFINQTQVPLVYHFGGLSSVVPTEMIERIDFYPSNFGVRYGRLHGGVIDVALRPPDTECRLNGEPTGEEDCFHALAQVDLIDARVMASGPLGGDWSFALSARRSWVDAWIGAVLNGDGPPAVSNAPVYYDYQAIVEYRPTDRDRLSIRLFGSDDQLRLLFDQPPQPGLGGSLNLSTRFVRGQIALESEIADRLTLKGMVSAGYEKQQFSLGNNLDFDFDFYPLEYRTELNWGVTDWLSWNVGIDYQATPLTASVRAPNPPRPGDQPAGTLIAANTFETNTQPTLHRPAAFTEVDLKILDRWQIVPGIRVDHTREAQSLAVSPRLYTRYNIFGKPFSRGGRGPWEPRTTLKGGVGLFQQPPQIQELDPVFGTPGLSNQKAMHYSLGAEQEFTEQIELSIEGFYKDYTDLVSRVPNAVGQFDYDNQGTGRSYGGELLLKYKPDDFFFGWVAYSISRSVRTDTPGSTERFFQFDQTHNLTVLGSFKLPWGIETGAQFRLISGSPYTPNRGQPTAILAADGSEYVPIIGQPFSERLPLFHQLDLRVDKKWQFEHWAFSTYLDVRNVYNRQAAEGVSYNYNFTQQQFATGLPILPSLGIRGEL